MPEVLDIAIVTMALAGSAWFVARRLFKRDAPSCASACGKCEPSEAKSDLVQIGKPKA
jgi:hypothetical protein